MDPIIKKQRIASLILKEKIDELSKSEKEELTSWLQASPKNKKIYARLQEKSFSEDIARYQQISTTRGLDNYRRRYVQTNKRLLGKWYWAAAVAVFIIGIATLFFYQEEHPTVAKTTISPGSSKAMLILNNGEIISLSEKNKTEIVATEELSIRNEGSRLRYTASENTKNEQANNYNELIVPKGGEFTLTLSDGTKVWLNSQSKIRYPVIFNDITREVYLEGEAFFDVAKQKNKPFIVKTREQDIEALGTKFNVRAREEEDRVVTTLLQGSVRMESPRTVNNGYLLKPGQTLNINTTTYQAELIEYAEPTEVLLWINGKLKFKQHSLLEITNIMEKLYDLKFVYDDESLKTERFTGEFSTDNLPDEILNVLMHTNHFSYKKEGRIIRLSKK